MSKEKKIAKNICLNELDLKFWEKVNKKRAELLLQNKDYTKAEIIKAIVYDYKGS